jgi:hypothetical protein
MHAHRQQISKGDCGTQIILKKFIRGKNWDFEGKFFICQGKIHLDLA